MTNPSSELCIFSNLTRNDTVNKRVRIALNIRNAPIDLKQRYLGTLSTEPLLQASRSILPLCLLTYEQIVSNVSGFGWNPHRLNSMLRPSLAWIYLPRASLIGYSTLFWTGYHCCPEQCPICCIKSVRSNMHVPTAPTRWSLASSVSAHQTAQTVNTHRIHSS